MKEILAALGKERREVFCGGLREEVVRDICRLNSVNVNNNNMGVSKQPTIISL